MLAYGLSKAAIAEELSCKPADITQYAALSQMADYLRTLIDQWPRRALYDLHIAARKFPEAVERFVAKQRGDGVTVAAVASFVRDLKEPAPVETAAPAIELAAPQGKRSEEHTSELQSLMRISYAVFCLKKKKTKHNN